MTGFGKQSPHETQHSSNNGFSDLKQAALSSCSWREGVHATLSSSTRVVSALKNYTIDRLMPIAKSEMTLNVIIMETVNGQNQPASGFLV